MMNNTLFGFCLVCKFLFITETPDTVFGFLLLKTKEVFFSLNLIYFVRERQLSDII